jgi:D-beta-D-heptose 7-phosphate kinase/D-beta-D-heptose 1-phosphate adenosyltransferase
VSGDLLHKLASWRPFSALVVGDFMLDQIVLGDAERLTGDAPVPILHVRETRQVAGGAANVCMNLAALHANVMAFGVVGDDPEGLWLTDSLRKAGIDCSAIVTDPSRPTTVKRSLVGRAQHRHPQKMFRVDQESTSALSDAIRARLLERFDAALEQADVVAIEDYDKGVCAGSLCQEIIERCRRAGKEVIVDPARLDDYARYRGATSVTPNRTEAERATGLPTHDSADVAHNAELARALRDAHEFETVVLTLDRHGALLLTPDGRAVAVPTLAREVYDVTGAGDMVLAALVAARANGVNWEDSVRFANAAAGLEVEVFGVQPIPFERIHRQVLLEARGETGKRRTPEEAAIEAAAARQEGKRVVFTNGCFDIIHAGHIRLLRQAATHGDLLIVGLNSDDSITRLKGAGRPVHAEPDRIEVLSELESVDIVVVFEEDTPMTLLERIRPDVLVKGGDYSKDQVVGGAFVESYGGRIELIERLEGRSTTQAINRLRLA